MKLKLRTATIDDGPSLEQIERECFSHPHWRAESFLHYQCTVATAKDLIAGFLVSRALVAEEREILNVAVRPEWRRHGVASLLLQNELTRGGTFFLEVRESNLAARALYSRFGFREAGRRVDYYQFPNETAIVMRMK